MSPLLKGGPCLSPAYRAYKNNKRAVNLGNRKRFHDFLGGKWYMVTEKCVSLQAKQTNYN